MYGSIIGSERTAKQMKAVALKDARLINGLDVYETGDGIIDSEMMRGKDFVIIESDGSGATERFLTRFAEVAAGIGRINRDRKNKRKRNELYRGIQKDCGRRIRRRSVFGEIYARRICGKIVGRARREEGQNGNKESETVFHSDRDIRKSGRTRIFIVGGKAQRGESEDVKEDDDGVVSGDSGRIRDERQSGRKRYKERDHRGV